MFSMSVFKSLILEIILLDGLNNWDYQDICTVYPTDAHNNFNALFFLQMSTYLSDVYLQKLAWPQLR